MKKLMIFLMLFIVVLSLMITGCSAFNRYKSPNDPFSLPNDEQGNTVKMVFSGNPSQIYQEFDINGNMDGDSIYKVSALFKTKEAQISTMKHFGIRINFFKSDGTWFQAEDIDLASISISHDVPKGENNWTDPNPDGSRIRHSGGNIFVVNLDAGVLSESEEDWRELSFAFRIPDDAASVRIGLYNHAESVGSTIVWGDSKLIEIDNESINLLNNNDFSDLGLLSELRGWILSGSGIFVITKADSTLADWEGVRPRLFLTAHKVQELRALLSDPQYLEFTKTVARRANSAHTHPPKYRDDGGENLWQRGVGNTMPYLAMAYLLSDEEHFLEKAINWAVGAATYPIWHQNLGAGHLLMGTSIIYDWLYDDLGDENRAIIREKLIQEAYRDFPEARYLQNHLWVVAAGVGATGFALYDEVQEGKAYIQRALNEFNLTMDALGPDGASHEGMGYWQYGVEYMLKFMHLARDLLDIDMYDHPWWENTAYYALYLSTPLNGWDLGGPSVDFADSPRVNWYGPDYLLRALAAEYNNGYVQWLAQRSNDAGVDNDMASWLNLIWYDPSIQCKSPDNLPTLWHFDDMEIVSARSDWSGDESLIAFKCGPALGHYATDRFNYNSNSPNYLHRSNQGHVHPDANTFVIFGNGEWLVRNPGYVRRRTDYQNTLLVDGQGQIGQHEGWWSNEAQMEHKLHPRIIKVESSNQFDYMVGDARDSYPYRLEKFQRHLLFIKPNILIVIDDIVSNSPQVPREFVLLFHLEHSAFKQPDGSFLTFGERSALRVESLTPQFTLEGGMKTVLRRDGSPLSRYALTVSNTAVEWRNAVAFSWADINSHPTQVVFEEIDDLWIFTAEDYKVTFDWVKKEVIDIKWRE